MVGSPSQLRARGNYSALCSPGEPPLRRTPPDHRPFRRLPGERRAVKFISAAVLTTALAPASSQRLSALATTTKQAGSELATSPMCRKRTSPLFLTVAASRRQEAVRGPAQRSAPPRGTRKKDTTRRERAAPSRVKTREISEKPGWLVLHPAAIAMGSRHNGTSPQAGRNPPAQGIPASARSRTRSPDAASRVARTIYRMTRSAVGRRSFAQCPLKQAVGPDVIAISLGGQGFARRTSAKVIARSPEGRRPVHARRPPARLTRRCPREGRFPRARSGRTSYPDARHCPPDKKHDHGAEGADQPCTLAKNPPAECLTDKHCNDCWKASLSRILGRLPRA